MAISLLDDAFDHHVWATRRLIDACTALSAEQLATLVPGTDRSILQTLRHVVGSDCFHLQILSPERTRIIDEDQIALHELRTVMDEYGGAWAELLAKGPAPDATVRDIDDAGYKRDASIGLRLAQAVHHGTDHRSQVSTALTMLGVEPPGISVWDFGLETGRSVDLPPAG